jgi:N-acetyl-anhydromuramyl-L-alanine amidase AmpD
MAASLDEEVKRKRAEATLLDNGEGTDDSDPDPDNDPDPDDSSEETPEPQAERTIYAPATKKGPSYVLVPASQTGKTQPAAPDTSGHIDLAPPGQMKLPEGATPPEVSTPQTTLTIPTPTPESPSGPTDVQTDTETGTPYVIDSTTGQKIPHAELATPADKEAFKPSDVMLAERTVAGTAETQPAPDKLTQAERGQLVSTPPGTAPKAVGVAAPVTYPTIAEDQGAPGAPPKVQPAQPVTPAISPPEAQPTAPAAPKPRQSQFGLTPDEYKASLTEQQATAATTAAPDASGLNINTDYTADRNSYAPGRTGDGKVHGIVLHSTDAGEKSSLETLTHGGVSAHYLVNEAGQIYNLVPDGDTAYHAGKTTGKYANYNNSNTIGIEQVHVDGTPWAPAEVAATARLVAYLKSKHGVSDNDIMGHSDVAPGRKQDPLNYPWQGFFSAVDKQGGAAPATAVPGTAATAPAGATAAVSGTQGYISGKATTFGYKDPDDSGVGAPKLGGLSTNNTDLIGIAVPQAALQSYVSAHPADWRKARVDVVGQNGQHVLVPIVDLGPRDTSGEVAADFTQGLTNLTGNTGDQNYQFKIIPNAGPDVMKNPQGFADEQAAIRAGIDTGAKIRPQASTAKKPSYVLAPLQQSPAESVAADTAKQYDQQSQMDTLTQLADSTPNVVGLYKSLDKDVPGVTPAMRQQFQANLKPQIIGLMKQKYPDLSDDDAWAKAQSDPVAFGALDTGRDFWDKFVGSFQQLSPLLQQATGVTAEQSHVNAFLDQSLPKGSDADKHALLAKLYAMPADQRGAYVASLIPNPQTGVPGQDPQEVVSALDRLSDPNYAKQQAAQMAQAQAALKQRMATDPRLVGTPAAFASENLAQIPEMIAAAGIPPLMAAQIGQQLREQMKAEHPEYSEDELDQKSAYGTLVQLVGQEAAGRLFGAGTGALMQGIKSPIKKAIAQALTNTGLGAGISGGTQALTNVVTGEPDAGQGVAAATIGGALQGGVTGAVHAGAEALHPEARPVVPEASTKAPLGQEPVTPHPETGPAGGAVRGAEPETMATGGAEVEAAPTVNEPAETSGLTMQAKDRYGNVIGESTVTKGRSSARTTVGEMLDAGGDSAVLAQEALNNGWSRDDPMPKPGEQPPPVTGPKGGAVRGAEPETMATGQPQPVPSVTQPRQPVTQEAVARRAYELYEERTKSGQPGTAADDYAQAQKELSQATEPPPATVSEAEPINSAIANRYTAERMARGELGQIDPSEGKSTEEMVQQGLQMSRDQRDGLIKNFMKGTGGDLDQQGAAIRAREAILSEQARSASRAADADPTNPQLQAQAKAASNAVTAFHNGPIKKFKKVWSDSGRVLQREIPLDYTTFNGMKEAYLKGKGKGNEAPPELEPKLKQMADQVSKIADAERAKLNNYGKEVGDYVEEKSRGKPPLPSDDQIRTRLMEITKNLPCRT